MSNKEQIRLNKYIAQAGICSRRDADKLITKGYVQVNGETVTKRGTKVHPNDEVRFKGEVITPEQKVYILLNKPKGYITTVTDPHHREKVTDLVKGHIDQRIYPVGRLDKDTTGLLLLTNDGNLTQRLSHPKHEVTQEYEVTLAQPLTDRALQKLKQGITLSDGPVQPDNVRTSDKKVFVQLHSGRNRIIRRIFDALNYPVKHLDRIRYAGLTTEGLSQGEWRHLTQREIQQLKAYGHVN
jgi:23S rRNA pseudouridine2605 synthase